MNRSIRQALPLLLKAKCAATWPQSLTYIEQAYALLSPRKASPKAKATRARKSARKAAKYEKHRLSTKEIRAEVLERADDVCELPVLCLRMGDPTELHHMESGSGRRREKQSVANTVMACMTDHRGYHHDPEAYRLIVQLHCAQYGYPMPSRFLREPRAQRAPESPSSPSVIHDPVRRPNVG